MKERPVLIIVEIIVDFLIPDHTFPSRLSVEHRISISYISPQSCLSLPNNPELAGREEKERTYRDINHLQPEGTSNQVIRKHRSTLQTRIHPSLRVRVRDIQSRDRYSVDLVGGFGDIALDGFLVGVTKDGGHTDLQLESQTVRK